MGSKRRIVKHLLPIILEDRKPQQYYIEPFVGGGNMIEHVQGNRIGSDAHTYLIAMFRAMQKGWIPPKQVSEERYKHIKNNKDLYSDHLVGFVGFNSFGSKWFGGYCRNKEGTEHYWRKHFNNVTKQAPKLKSAEFYCGSYLDLSIPEDSIIYCDPPYRNTTKYSTSKGFDHDVFWEWCRTKVHQGHQVFISEYSAPKDFVPVWQKELGSGLDHKNHGKKAIESLFVHDLQDLL